MVIRALVVQGLGFKSSRLRIILVQKYAPLFYLKKEQSTSYLLSSNSTEKNYFIQFINNHYATNPNPNTCITFDIMTVLLPLKNTRTESNQQKKQN